jgi:hypothetical protein
MKGSSLLAGQEIPYFYEICKVVIVFIIIPQQALNLRYINPLYIFKPLLSKI